MAMASKIVSLLACAWVWTASGARPVPMLRWTFNNSFETMTGETDFNLDLSANAQLKDEADGTYLNMDGQTYTYARTAHTLRSLSGFPLEKSYSIWVRLPDLRLKMGIFALDSTYNEPNMDGYVHVAYDALQFQRHRPNTRFWEFGTESSQRDVFFSGLPQENAYNAWVHMALVWHSSGLVEIYRNGLLIGSGTRAGNPYRFDKTKTRVLFGSAQQEDFWGDRLRGDLDLAEIYDRALTANEVKVISDSGREGNFCFGESHLSNSADKGQVLDLDCSGSTILIAAASYGDGAACDAVTSMKMVSRACDGLPRCSVHAEDYVFNDNCVTATGKSLSVDYCCVSSHVPKAQADALHC